jgi:hypothetical protein
LEKSHGPGNKQRVNFLLPTDLMQEARRASAQLDCTLTDFVRASIASFLKDHTKARMAKEMEEGYKANYAYYARLNKEWEIADSE